MTSVARWPKTGLRRAGSRRWPVTLIRDLGRASQAAEAVRLSEALAAVDPARPGSFAGEAAVALAEAGLADDARTKIAENTERWPDDVRVRLLAGDALAMLGNTEAALAQFQVALLLAQQAKDFKVIRDLSTRIFRLTHPAADEMVQRRQPRSRARSQRKGKTIISLANPADAARRERPGQLANRYCGQYRGKYSHVVDICWHKPLGRAHGEQGCSGGGRLRHMARRTFLSASAVTAVAVPLISGTALTGTADAAIRQVPDPGLRALLAQVDPDRIKATILRLVQFGTRHTASSQTDPVRGIGAATAWVLSQFQAIAATSSGRMTVHEQTFTQPVSSNIPVPTTITNVIATLQGTSSPERFYVITGHLDSRVTDVLNFTADAPGADDDGSGVAVALELARLFATRQFPGTLVFATVAGEEQGLYGSTFMATQMKAAGDDVQGMFSNDIVGASQAFDGTRPDPFTVRLFVETIPTAVTANADRDHAGDRRRERRRDPPAGPVRHRPWRRSS